MAGEFTITTSTVKEKAEELRNLNESLKKQIDELQAAMTKLDASWDGDSSEKFASVFKNDLIQFNNFYNAIAVYSTTLTEIAKQYDDAEIKNLGIIGA